MDTWHIKWWDSVIKVNYLDRGLRPRGTITFESAPGSSEIEAAVDLAVELGVVEVEAEGLRPQRRLQLRLEVGQPLLRRRRVKVEDELHQLSVLEHVDLNRIGQSMKKRQWDFLT